MFGKACICTVSTFPRNLLSLYSGSQSKPHGVTFQNDCHSHGPVYWARSQYPEGPATGHFGTGFSWCLFV
jgi:hypothetical protein